MSGMTASDSASLLSLPALRACSTRGGRLAALAGSGRVAGSSRPASPSRRSGRQIFWTLASKDREERNNMGRLTCVNE
ncbi:hypothetical protein D3C78_1562180 [compost metagenome]